MLFTSLVALLTMTAMFYVATSRAWVWRAYPGINKAHATQAIRFSIAIDLVRNVPCWRRTHFDPLACTQRCNEVHLLAKSALATKSAASGAGNRGANSISMLTEVYQNCV
jgi:hypothetical protein